MHEGWLLKMQTSVAGGWVASRPSCGRVSYITDCPLKTLLWMPTSQMSWPVHINQKKSPKLTQKNYRYTIKCERLVLFSSPSSLPQVSWNCSSLEMWERMVSQRHNPDLSFWSPNLTSILWYRRALFSVGWDWVFTAQNWLCFCFTEKENWPSHHGICSKKRAIWQSLSN